MKNIGQVTKKKENKKQNNNGITLITLVITIIVLLILAGISINLVLGENGILHYAKMAGEKQTKAQLKEELELAILDIQTEKASNGEEFTRQDLSELIKIGAIVESVETPAIGEYKDYGFTVDEQYVVTIEDKVAGAKPVITLSKNTEETVEKVTIHVEVSIEEGTIESVTKPDGTTTEETSFDYEVDKNGVYTFIAKGNNGRRGVASITITNTKEVIAEPIITSEYGYPVLTAEGVKLEGTTTITFDTKEGLENYYSIDGGSTWTRYTEPFNEIGTGTIKAKSERDGITLAEASKKVEMAEDALGPQAYDGNSDTAEDSSYGKTIKVSSEMQDKYISLTTSVYAYDAAHASYINFFDKEGNTLQTMTVLSNFTEEEILIPSKTDEIQFSSWPPGPNANISIVEISPSSKLELSEESVSLLLDETKQLTCRALTADLTWESDNPGIARVENGLITPVTIGNCTITCSLKSDSSTSVSCNVSVLPNTMYLYTPGDEHQDFSGGWESKIVQGAPGTLTSSKDSGYLDIKNSSVNWCAGYFQTGKEIDFSKYSKLVVTWSKTKYASDTHFTIMAGNYDIHNGDAGTYHNQDHYCYTERYNNETPLNQEIRETITCDITDLKSIGSIYLYVYTGELKIHEVYLEK